MLDHQKSSLMMSSAQVPAYVLRFVAFGAFANDNHWVKYLQQKGKNIRSQKQVWRRQIKQSTLKTTMVILV